MTPTMLVDHQKNYLIRLNTKDSANYDRKLSSNSLGVKSEMRPESQTVVQDANQSKNLINYENPTFGIIIQNDEARTEQALVD